MRAKEAKKVIDSKLADIEKAIALFYGQKYYKTIKERLDKVLYYVYDSDLQTGRIMEVELMNIARSFAYDVIEDLDIDETKKEQLQDRLARIIMDGASFADTDLNNFIKNEVEAISSFSEDKNKYYSRLLEAVEHYSKDFEVKEWMKRMDSANDLEVEIDQAIKKLKEKLLRKYFGFKSVPKDKIEEIWAASSLFNPLTQKQMEIFGVNKQLVIQTKNLFYQLLGYSDEEIAEFNAGKEFISKELYEACEEEYAREFNRLISKITQITNLDEIFSDLEKRGYIVNKETVINFIFSTKLLLGVNVKCLNDVKKPDSFILYPNLLSLYSEEFDDTCIHEMIHYLGGYSDKFDKKGLHYESNALYLELEEAYANYIAKVVSNEYVSKYGNIMEIKSKESFEDYKVNRSLEYMDKVFSLYKEEIIKVHLSENISLNEAKELLPIEQIAKAVYRINNANSLSESKEISRREIIKLRGSKR